MGATRSENVSSDNFHRVNSAFLASKIMIIFFSYFSNNTSVYVLFVLMFNVPVNIFQSCQDAFLFCY